MSNCCCLLSRFRLLCQIFIEFLKILLRNRTLLTVWSDYLNLISIFWKRFLQDCLAVSRVYSSCWWIVISSMRLISEVLFLRCWNKTRENIVFPLFSATPRQRLINFFHDHFLQFLRNPLCWLNFWYWLHISGWCWNIAIYYIKHTIDWKFKINISLVYKVLMN